MYRYVLDPGGNAVAEPDLMKWATFFEKADRQVAFHEAGGVRVSTVFLALDHRFGGDGPPLLWETMIFGGPHDGYQRRYSTREGALAGHAYAVAFAQASA